jgi:hypothetical protein
MVIFNEIKHLWVMACVGTQVMPCAIEMQQYWLRNTAEPAKKNKLDITKK